MTGGKLAKRRGLHTSEHRQMTGGKTVKASGTTSEDRQMTGGKLSKLRGLHPRIGR